VDWQALLHDRRFQIAAMGVAGVGGYVLYRRKQSTGSSSSATPGAQAAGTGGTFSSAGTDLATALGNYRQDQQGALDQFAAQLQDTLTQLKAITPSPAPGPAPAPAPSPAPAPAPSPAPAPAPSPTAPQYVTVTKFTTSNPAWSSTLSGIAGHYHTSVAALLKLNPSVSNPNVIRTGAQIRVK
jgi:LysM repeat protein